MSWHHNAEKVLTILFKSKGDKDGWVEMNDKLKKVGLTHPGDIKFAFHWLADKDRKWVESVPPHSLMELGIWGPHKRIMSLENTTIKARLTQFGKDEKARRIKPSQWPAWVRAAAAVIGAIIAILTFYFTVLAERPSTQSPTEKAESLPTPVTPSSSSAPQNHSDPSASTDSVPTMSHGTDTVLPNSSSSHVPVKK